MSGQQGHDTDITNINGICVMTPDDRGFITQRLVDCRVWKRAHLRLKNHIIFEDGSNGSPAIPEPAINATDQPEASFV